MSLRAYAVLALALVLAVAFRVLMRRKLAERRDPDFIANPQLFICADVRS